MPELLEGKRRWGREGRDNTLPPPPCCQLRPSFLCCWIFVEGSVWVDNSPKAPSFLLVPKPPTLSIPSLPPPAFFFALLLFRGPFPPALTSVQTHSSTAFCFSLARRHSPTYPPRGRETLPSTPQNQTDKGLALFIYSSLPPPPSAPVLSVSFVLPGGPFLPQRTRARWERCIQKR